MPAGWTNSITPVAASYAVGASILTPTYAAGASIYIPVYIQYENGQEVLTTPVNTVAPVVSGTAQVNQVLSCSEGTWIGFGTITFTYQWYLNTGGSGFPIPDATQSTYTCKLADLGYSIHCVVTGSNVYGTGEGTSNNSDVVGEPVPVNTVAPAVTGTTTVGQTLSCSTGTWTSLSSISYTYQWKRDGSPITSATSSTYVLVTADYNTSIICTVVATNSAGPGSPANSNTVGPIAEAAPVNTVAPVVSGYIFYGNTLSCTTGTWTSITTPTYTYQWKRNGSNITSATSSTYVATEADQGQSITCNVTATNTTGGTSQVSNTLTTWMPSASSLTLWLDANKPSSINSGTPSSGDAISSMADQSSNAASYTQSTSGKRPTWITNQLNGKPVMRFSAASQQNLIEATINTVSRTSAFTIVMVVKLSSFDQAYKYMLNAKASDCNAPLAYSTNASYLDAFFGDDVSAQKFKVFRMTTISTPTSWHYISVFYNGSGSTTMGNFSANLDTSALTLTSTSGNDGGGKNIVGSYKDSVIYNWNGDIAEVMIFNSQLTGSNLTDVQTYLNRKYGL